MSNIRLVTITPDSISNPNSIITLPGTLSVSSITSLSTTDASSLSIASVTMQGGLSVSKSIYVGGNVLFSPSSATSVIGMNTVISSDNKSLILSGSTGANYVRGASLELDGVQLNSGSAQLIVGNGGSFTITTGNTTSGIFNSTGTVNFNNSSSSTSSSSGSIMMAGGLSIACTSDATSNTNGGGLTIAGGISCAKKIFVGGSATVTGTSSFTGVLSIVGTTNATSTTTGIIQISGGVGIVKDVFIGGNSSILGTLSITSTVSIISTSDTSFTTGGGLSIGKGMNIAGIITSTSDISLTGTFTNTNTTDSTGVNNGSAVFSGGIGVAKTLRVGTDIYANGNSLINGTSTFAGVTSITNTTDSTAIGNGSIVVSGGISIAKNTRINSALFVTGTSTLTGNVSLTNNLTAGGAVTFTGTTASTTSSSGILILSGGFGVAGNINGAGTTNILSGTVDSTNSTSGTLVISGGLGVAKSVFIGAAVNVATSITGASLSITGTTSIVGILSITNTTDSSSVITGSTVVSGGLGIAKNIFIGGNISVTGTSTLTGNSTIVGITAFTNTLDSTNLTTAAVVLSGGLSITKKLRVGDSTFFSNDTTTVGLVSITNTTGATNTTSGCLVLSGGIGIAQSIFAGGTLNVTGISSFTGAVTSYGILTVANTTDSLSSATGSTVISGGLGVIKNTFLGGNLSVSGTGTFSSDTTVIGICYVTNTTEASSSITGSTIISGGLGIAKKLYCGGNATFSGTGTFSNTVTFTNVTDSSSSSTGSVVFSGGIGVTRNLYIGGNSAITGTMLVTGNMTNTAGNLTFGSVSLVDSSGIFLVQSAAPAFRITGTSAITATAYSNSLDIFSLGSAYTDTNHEALQISTTGTTGFTIMTRKAGTGTSRTLFLQSTASNVGQLTLNTDGSISVPGTTDSTSTSTGIFRVSGGAVVSKNLSIGSKLYLYGATSGSVSVIAPGTTTSYDLTLPSTLPAGNNYALVSSTTGTLSWSLMQQANASFTTVAITDTTDSTSISTGPLTIAGGVGISKSLFVGTNLTVGTNLNMSANGMMLYTITGTSAPTLTTRSTGTRLVLYPLISASAVDYAIGVESNNMWFSVPNNTGNGFKFYTKTTNVCQIDNTAVSIFHTTNATSTGSGALIISGGLGVAKTTYLGIDLNVAGNTFLTNTTDSTSISTGVLQISGGAAVAKNMSVGGSLKLYGATSGNLSLIASGTTTSYSLTFPNTLPAQSSAVVVDASGNLTFSTSIGGSSGSFSTLTLSDTSDSTSTETGVLQVAGGASIKKKLYLGGTLNITGSTSGTVTIAVPATNNNPTYTLPAAYPNSNGLYLTSDTSGNFSWTALSQNSSYSFTAANNISSSTNVTNMIFTSMTKLDVLVAIVTSTPSDFSAKFTLHIYPDANAGMTIFSNYVGDDTGINFDINSSTGQVRYTSSNVTNWTSTTFSWSAPDLYTTPTGGFPQSFYAANNVSSATNVTNLIMTQPQFVIYITITITNSTPANSTRTLVTLQGIYQESTSTWTSSQSAIGPASGITFSLTSTGQVQYTSSNVTGWLSTLFQFTKVALPAYTAVSFDTVTVLNTTDSNSINTGALQVNGGLSVSKAFVRAFAKNPQFGVTSATQTLTANTFTTINFSNFNPITWFPQISGITYSGTTVTLPVSGLYTFSIVFNSSSGSKMVSIYVNSSPTGNGATTSITGNTDANTNVLVQSTYSTSVYTGISGTYALNGGTQISFAAYSTTAVTVTYMNIFVSLVQYLG